MISSIVIMAIQALAVHFPCRLFYIVIPIGAIHRKFVGKICIRVFQKIETPKISYTGINKFHLIIEMVQKIFRSIRCALRSLKMDLFNALCLFPINLHFMLNHPVYFEYSALAWPIFLAINFEIWYVIVLFYRLKPSPRARKLSSRLSTSC